MKKPLELAKDEDLRGARDALLRAATAARKTAILTNTALIVSIKMGAYSAFHRKL